MSPNYDKKSKKELVAALKAIGMVASGDNYTLIHRLKLNDKCTENKLITDGGINPCTMKMVPLRNCAAKAGVR